MKLIFLFCFLVQIQIASQVQLGPFAGAVTDSSADFIVKVYSSQKVQIELFEDGNLNSIFSESAVSDTLYNYAKINIRGLKPNTQYYYRAIVNGTTSKRWHSFKTFPKEQAGFSFGFGSCQQSSYSKWMPEIFPAAANDSLRFFIQIGDWTYPDTTEKKYGYRFNEKFDLIEKSYQSKYNYNYPFASEVLSRMPIMYVYDDHDFAANNPDGTTPEKLNSVNGYKMFFPHYPLANENNGIWQSFSFGDVDFFMLDTRSQRSPNENALDGNGKFSPPVNHSLLSGYEISGEDQLSWLMSSLKKSNAKWKIIVSSVLFNPGYGRALNSELLLDKYPWMKKDIIDKWAGFPADRNALVSFVKENNIKNIIVISGDSHSSYIDDGSNSFFPEISSSNLDVNNSNLNDKLKEDNISIWSEGSYQGTGHAYGKVSFIYGKENYALLEIINEKGETAVQLKVKEQ